LFHPWFWRSPTLPFCFSWHQTVKTHFRVARAPRGSFFPPSFPRGPVPPPFFPVASQALLVYLHTKESFARWCATLVDPVGIKLPDSSPFLVYWVIFVVNFCPPDFFSLPGDLLGTNSCNTPRRSPGFFTFPRYPYLLQLSFLWGNQLLLAFYTVVHTFPPPVLVSSLVR